MSQSYVQPPPFSLQPFLADPVLIPKDPRTHELSYLNPLVADPQTKRDSHHRGFAWIVLSNVRSRLAMLLPILNFVLRRLQHCQSYATSTFAIFHRWDSVRSLGVAGTMMLRMLPWGDFYLTGPLTGRRCGSHRRSIRTDPPAVGRITDITCQLPRRTWRKCNVIMPSINVNRPIRERNTTMFSFFYIHVHVWAYRYMLLRYVHNSEFQSFSLI